MDSATQWWTPAAGDGGGGDDGGGGGGGCRQCSRRTCPLLVVQLSGWLQLGQARHKLLLLLLLRSQLGRMTGRQLLLLLQLLLL